MRYLLTHKKSVFVPVLLLGFVALIMMQADQRASFAQEESAQSPTDPIVRISATKTKVKVVKQFSKVIQLDHRIKRVDGFNPDVIKVTPLGTKAIRVHAIEPGITSLTLIDETNKVFSVEMLVTGDVRHLQAYIADMFPKDSVQAVEVGKTGGVVVLRGWVTQPEHITELTELGEQFYDRVINQMKVGGEQRVVLRVKIMEAQRSKIRKMGFNFLYVNRSAVLSSSPGKLAPLGTLSTSTPGGIPSAAITAATLTDPSIAFGLVSRNSAFTGFLDALKEESLLKILAEPNLIATNGRPARMLSGGEFPILVPSTLGNISIEFKPFGVELEAVPIILGNGRIRLELHPSVSEKDFSTAVQAANILVPGTKKREVNTMVDMKFGETLMIAGLIQKQQIATTSKIPVLGDMPWIGTAFSRKSYQDAETELVIMVTPELVAPIPANQLPHGGPGQFTAVPTDRELYLDQMLEVPKYVNGCETCPQQGNRFSNLNNIAPSTVPSTLNPQSPGITPVQPGNNGRLTPAPNQQEHIIPPAPQLPTEAMPQLPPVPTKPIQGKTAHRSRRSTLRSRNKNKYELPIWAREIKPDPFSGPDPAHQVGFTTRPVRQPQIDQRHNLQSRTSSRSSYSYRNLPQRSRETELIEPRRNLLLPR